MEALRRVGIDVSPEELDRRIAQALLEVVPPHAVGDLGAEFSSAERAVLEAGGVDLSPLRPGEDESVLRTATGYAALLASSLTVREAARRLGVDGSRVRQRLSARQMYGIRRPTGWLLPIFQFDEDRLVPGIERVLPRLNPRLHPLAVLGWFTRPHPDLHRPGDPEETPIAPLEWLRSGGTPEVAAELAGDAAGYV